MKRYIAIILLSALGCITPLSENIKTCRNSYEAVVFDDGISLEEAGIVAQNELIEQNFVQIYDLAHPQFMSDVIDLHNHEKYWFVYFKETRKSRIKYIFMVIINKHTGNIKFADDYNKDNRWVLEAALFRR